MENEPRQISSIWAGQYLIDVHDPDVTFKNFINFRSEIWVVVRVYRKPKNVWPAKKLTRKNMFDEWSDLSREKNELSEKYLKWEKKLNNVWRAKKSERYFDEWKLLFLDLWYVTRKKIWQVKKIGWVKNI